MKVKDKAIGVSIPGKNESLFLDGCMLTPSED